MTETIMAYGHPNVSAMNKTTFEVTRDEHLTKKGDCIIAVSANRGICDLSAQFKNLLKRDDADVTILLQVDTFKEFVKAQGSRELILTHPTDMVVRKSSFICDRTLAIHADKAACDLSRTLAERMRKNVQKILVTVSVAVG